MDTVALVREFENACGATIPTTPTQPPVEKLKLRLSLELEELYEKAQAMGLEGTFCDMMIEKSGVQACMGIESGEDVPYLDHVHTDFGPYDPVALLDACCDQRYVQDGTVLTCGLQEIFYPAFAEVQRSNMSKFPKTMDEALDTCSSYDKQGVSTSWTIGNKKAGTPMVIKRVADGKILKSINYSPAELTQFFT